MNSLGIPILFSDFTKPGFVYLVARPESFRPSKLEIDLKPSDAVRIPGSREIIYSNRPHRESHRARIKSMLQTMPLPVMSKPLRASISGFVV